MYHKVYQKSFITIITNSNSGDCTIIIFSNSSGTFSYQSPSHITLHVDVYLQIM